MIFDPPYTVVIIDDDPEVISVMTLVLNSAFPELLQINPYTKFKTGFEFIKANEINVVFLDLNLLDEDGIDGLEKIKALHKKCQVVTFSADTALNTILTCYNSGANYFMKKPINKTDLKEIVNNCVLPFKYWHDLIKDVSKG